MTSTEEFLEYLVSLDIKLWIEDGRLRCRASKEQLTPEIRNKLAERKEEILQFFQQNQLDSSNLDFQIKPVSRSENIPLSFSQQRLWILEQLESDNVAYNEGGAVRLEGNLEVKNLENSLEEIIRRHEVIRTNIQTINGVPCQIINETTNLSLEKINLSELSKEQQLEAWEQIAFNQFQLPFNLEKDLLLRVILVKLGETSHILLVEMHHIVCDGWSFGVLIKELSTLYEAYQRGMASPLPELTIQYADYAAWQREWLSGERLQNQIDYWTKKLSGLPPLLELPIDHPRPPVRTFKGAKERFTLNQELSQKLNQLSQQSGATLFMILLSAFSILLSRYSRQEDLAIGSPIANRNRAEIEPLIGFFLNTLVMRVNIEDNPTVEELIKQVKKTCLEAYAHQEVPFEKLVEELKPERNMSHSPLFQVMFVLQNAPTEELRLPGLTFSTIEIDSGIAKFDLSLSISETETGLAENWEYNTYLFKKETIERMMGHFQVLLEGIVTNPQEKVSKLPILTEVEKQQILVEWNNTAAEYPQNKCIHQLFEEQVSKTPDAVAVVYEEQQLTYQELNQKANQLAHYLQKLGVKPDTLVGICVERSLEMIIGLLGILKAGGAYVPIDPNYPTERVSYLLEDSAVSVLLTQEKLLEELLTNQAQVICLDKSWNEISLESEEQVESAVNPHNLAYVIYTSGSTGKPKGVLIIHQSLCNLVQAQRKAFGVTVSSRLLQSVSFSFDVATSDVFMTLCAGATLCLIDGNPLLQGTDLVKILSDLAITHIQLPVAALAVLPYDNLPALETLIIGGEPCSADLVKQWSKNYRFFNAYGPTEATVCATWIECLNNEQKPPIGKPISNLQIYILDSYLQPVPIGVLGELHIGGDGLARGYLNQPKLTSEKFISNPFDPTGQSKLYKTGDLCCYLPDGNIEYIGRIDHQVKIRGFRIELGEIESLLSTHPEIRETFVIAREDEPGNKRLVAYIVPQTEDIKVSDLRDFLKQKLPDYMIPSAFVLLEKLPLTPNGKVDRKALPAPDYNWLSEAEDFVPPQTQQETILSKIWSDLLRIDKISIHSNFFELGGDSILSIQVVARARQAGLKITPKQLFEHQTISDLALIAQPLGIITAEQGLVTGNAPLTPVEYWFFEQDLPEPDYWNQAILLEVENNINIGILNQVFSKLVEHHDALRLRFKKTENGWEQHYHSTVETFNIEVIDIANLANDQQLRAIETQANQWQSSLNIGEGPILRGGLFKLGNEQTYRLLIVIHHLAVDGISWRILLEDLGTAYQQLLQGKRIELPSKTTSYKQWGEALIKYAKSEAIHSQLEYWLSLANLQQQPLLIDYQADVNQNTEATSDNITVTLSTKETQALLQEVPQVYNTQINDILLTALVQSLSQWTEESSVLLELEGHGREDLFEGIDLSRTIGWFTSIFPVRLELTQQETNQLGEAIKSIKEQLRQIPQKGIGYGILKYLNQDELIQKQIKQVPQAQIGFNYLGQFDQMVDLSPIIKFASESSGLAHSAKSQRQHLIDLNSMIVLGQLEITWTYSKKFHKRETIEQLANNYLMALQALINHCQAPEAGGFTPSDFPDIELDQQELDDLLAEL